MLVACLIAGVYMIIRLCVVGRRSNFELEEEDEEQQQ